AWGSGLRRRRTAAMQGAAVATAAAPPFPAPTRTASPAKTGLVIGEGGSVAISSVAVANVWHFGFGPPGELHED
ncbi:hypothetical protein, partial [Stenotrophomonas sp. 278]|uniref:hypothetical protein n=1 Tax=Stenotrophomonas sp. 278 TaxID=2479851 RepID=UPI001C8CD63C